MISLPSMADCFEVTQRILKKMQGLPKENSVLTLENILEKKLKYGEVSQYYVDKFNLNHQKIQENLKSSLLGPKFSSCFDKFSPKAYTNLLKWIGRIKMTKQTDWASISKQLEKIAQKIFHEGPVQSRKRVCSLVPKKENACAIFSKNISSHCSKI